MLRLRHVKRHKRFAYSSMVRPPCMRPGSAHPSNPRFSFPRKGREAASARGHNVYRLRPPRSLIWVNGSSKGHLRTCVRATRNPRSPPERRGWRLSEPSMIIDDKAARIAEADRGCAVKGFTTRASSASKASACRSISGWWKTYGACRFSSAPMFTGQ